MLAIEDKLARTRVVRDFLDAMDFACLGSPVSVLAKLRSLASGNAHKLSENQRGEAALDRAKNASLNIEPSTATKHQIYACVWRRLGFAAQCEDGTFAGLSAFDFQRAATLGNIAERIFDFRQKPFTKEQVVQSCVNMGNLPRPVIEEYAQLVLGALLEEGIAQGVAAGAAV